MTGAADAHRDAAVGGEVATWPDRPDRLIVNVVDLRKRLGQRRDVSIDVILAPQQVLDSHTTRTPVIGTVTVESIERGVSVVGSVRFEWEGECRRCLDTLVGTSEADIDEICQVGAPPDSDIIDFDGDRIDILPMIRDAVGLSLPLAPLCRPDCVGPDPDRYPAYTVDTIEPPEPGPDPRWAALDQLDFD